MTRKRNPKREKAFEIWKEHNGDITNRMISEMVDAPEKTISAWKSRDKWNATLKKNDCSTTKKKRSTTKKKEQYEPVVVSDNLTDKQRLFCIYYIKYFNATKAYQKAYECDYITAMASGSRMLRNVKVSNEIDRLREDRLNEKKLSASEVLQKYIDIAFADIGDYVKSDDGFLVSLKPLDDIDTSIVSEISNTENGPKIKLADKMKALEMLAKYTDLLSDNDKKRLQEEKLKTEIAKGEVELEYLKGDTSDDAHERMQQYMKAIGKADVKAVFGDE